LAALLFVWQIPHFLALGWLYRRDYAQGGFCLLPVIDRAGDLTCRALMLFTLVLLPLGLTLTLAGVAGPAFAFGSVALVFFWLAAGVRLYRDRSRDNARQAFLASLITLPLLLGLLVADRGSQRGDQVWAGPQVSETQHPATEKEFEGVAVWQSAQTRTHSSMGSFKPTVRKR
jgi:heme O synthase-like polyprenyltransferase